MRPALNRLQAHKIAILPVLLLIPSLAQVSAQDDPLPTPQEILSRYIEEVGGVEAIRAQRHVTWTGKLEMPGLGVEGSVKLKAAAPNSFHLEVVSESLGTITQGYDGETAWVDNPMTGPMVLEGAELEAVVVQSDFYAELNYERNYAELGPVTQEDFDEAPCYKLKVTTAGGIEAFHYFSVDSGLLVAVSGNQPSPMGEVHVVSRIGGYQELGGRLYPTESRQEMMGAQQVMTLEEVAFEDIDDSAFDLPKPIQTLLATSAEERSE